MTRGVPLSFHTLLLFTTGYEKSNNFQTFTIICKHLVHSVQALLMQSAVETLGSHSCCAADQRAEAQDERH